MLPRVQKAAGDREYLVVQKHQKKLCAGLCHYKKQAVTVLSGAVMLNQELAVKYLDISFGRYFHKTKVEKNHPKGKPLHACSQMLIGLGLCLNAFHFSCRSREQPESQRADVLC